MVERQAADLVKWYEDLAEELFVFGLEGEGETVDDTAEYLQQLSDPVEVFRLVDKPGRGTHVGDLCTSRLTCLNP